MALSYLTFITGLDITDQTQSEFQFMNGLYHSQTAHQSIIIDIIDASFSKLRFLEIMGKILM